MQLFQIKRWDDGTVIYSAEAETLKDAVEAAVNAETNLFRASLVGARLDGASLDGASLDGASLDGASLVGASLDGASLEQAILDRIKFDFFGRLTALAKEVPGLRLALIEGRVNGSAYQGECACFMGTIGNLRHCNVKQISEVRADPDSATERFFLAIRKGDTPENNQVSKIVVGWIDEWTALMMVATGVAA